MARTIMQLNLITKHVIGPSPRGNHKNVNVVGALVNDENETSEALYNEEIQYVGNHMVGSRPAAQRQVGNQGWINERDGNWRDQQWRDRNVNWRDPKFEREKDVPYHDRITKSRICLLGSSIK